MSMKHAVILLMGMLFSLSALSQKGKMSIISGNKPYSKGEFAKAVILYRVGKE